MTMMDKLKQEFNRGNNMVRKLILVNVIFFVVFHLVRALLFMGGSEATFYTYISSNLMLPLSLSGFLKAPWTLVTHMFLHQGIWHLVFNMLTLFWMGSNFQDYLGNDRLLRVYIFGGITGAGLLILLYAVLPVFDAHQLGYALGASAAVYAIVTATATLLPDYEVRLFGVFNIQLKYLALFLVVLSFTEIGHPNSGGNIAHLGGALFGFLYIKNLYWKGSPFDRISYWWNNRKRRAPKTVIRQERSTTFVKIQSKRKATQEEIDMILDKINASGYESLNQYEKDLLYHYSDDED